MQNGRTLLEEPDYSLLFLFHSWTCLPQIVVALIVIFSLVQKLKFFFCLFRDDFGLGGDQSLADLPWFLVTLEQ